MKLIVTDLDGTLLNDKKVISKETYTTLQSARSQGIRVVLATARPLTVLDQMGLLDTIPYDALIPLNGGQIVVNNITIYERGIPKETLDSFLPKLLTHLPQQTITIDMNGMLYANFDLSVFDSYKQDFIISDFSDLPNMNTTRIMINLDSMDDYPLLESILPDSLYTHTVEGTTLCRILHRSVSKAKAIEHLSSLWNISKDKIVCFGDDLNDLEMFEFCGTAVAVENALDRVKSKATGLTRSNNDNGVAYWIQQHLLK